jgi:hypothetical protein
MKFGAMLFQHRGEDLAAYAKLAEQLGFESVWMGEHLAFPPFEIKSRYPGLPDGDIPTTAMRQDVNLTRPFARVRLSRVDHDDAALYDRRLCAAAAQSVRGRQGRRDP